MQEISRMLTDIYFVAHNGVKVANIMACRVYFFLFAGDDHALKYIGRYYAMYQGTIFNWWEWA